MLSTLEHTEEHVARLAEQPAHAVCDVIVVDAGVPSRALGLGLGDWFPAESTAPLLRVIEAIEICRGHVVELPQAMLLTPRRCVARVDHRPASTCVESGLPIA